MLLWLAFVGCDAIRPASEPDPATEIADLAETFIEEAMTRGIDLADTVRSVVFLLADSIVVDGNEYCGYAPWYQFPDEIIRPEITIAVNERCWIGKAKADHEALVFHELGHMILDRGHRNDLLPDNSRASMMIGGNLGGLWVKDAAYRRTYYIDELFDEQTGIPPWSLGPLGL